MLQETFQAYRHSGKYGIHGPVLTLIASVIVGFPLGLAYAYFTRWIPIIYLTFLATVGYGFAFGFLTIWLLKYAKVRNTMVAALCGLLAGGIGLYFAWSGHLHAIFKDTPWFWMPGDILAGMKQLYEEGSWALHSGDSITGIPLAIVWVVEAGIILGLSVVPTVRTIADTPFCEQNDCWLDEEKKISTIEAFTDPAHVAALRGGDLGPLLQAKPRAPESPTFGRLTLKHSPRCDLFCTVRIENIVTTIDKNGSLSENKQELTRNLMLPRSMFDLITKFENFQGTAPPAPPPAASPPTS